MSLRDLTKEEHTTAERQEFVKILFSGNIDPKLYAIYLKNQHPMYEFVEVCAMQHGLLNGMPDIRRAPYINADFLELWPDKDNPPQLLPVVQKYLDHIRSIMDQPQKLMAHIYVRHMGDLAGGQMIAKKVPGKGTMYKFEDPDKLKEAIRSKIDDSMADEAKVCFSFATEFFKEMLEIANEYKQ
jgi:heme oxygenase